MSANELSPSELTPGDGDPSESRSTREVVPRSGVRFPASGASSSATDRSERPRSAPPPRAAGAPPRSARQDPAAPLSTAPLSAAPLSVAPLSVAPLSIAEGERIADEFAAALAERERARAAEPSDDPARGTDEVAPAAPGDPRGGSAPASPRTAPEGAAERQRDDTSRAVAREARAPRRGGGGSPPDALRWHPAADIPASIRDTLAEGLAAANWLVERAREHPELSVHEYRKTVRRLRSVVRLLREPLGPRAYRSLDTGLRSAVAPTSGLRDARILLDALELAAPVWGGAGGTGLRESLAAEWRARIERLEAGDEEARVLAASRAPLARIAGEFREALPAGLGAGDLRRAVARSYRKARRAFRAAAECGEETRIHAARKRVKELRYQLEWLAQVSSKRVRRRCDRFAALAKELGEVTDLFVLARAVREHGPAAADAADRIHALAAARWEERVDARGRFFAERPRRFAKGVAKRA